MQREEYNLVQNQTRKLLLDAGIKLFAKYDYDQVSNKMITDMVHVNSAMISYYFQSKEKFYHAVVCYSSDLIISKFENFRPTNLDALNKEELIEQISVGLDIYLEAFFSQDGQDFSIIYQRNLIEAVNRDALLEYNRPIDDVTSRYLQLFTAYYQKTGQHETNVIFTMIKIASLVYFMILHERTVEVLIPDQMNAMKNLKNMLLQSVLCGY